MTELTKKDVELTEEELLEPLDTKKVIALEKLLEGWNQTQVADHPDVDVDRSTISKWVNEDSSFKRALHVLRQKRFGFSLHRLQSLVGKATDVIETQLDGGDADIAKWIYKTLGLEGNVHEYSRAMNGESDLVLDEFERKALNILRAYRDHPEAIKAIADILRNKNPREVVELAEYTVKQEEDVEVEEGTEEEE